MSRADISTEVGVARVVVERMVMRRVVVSFIVDW